MVNGTPTVTVNTRHQALNDQVNYKLYVILNSTPYELKDLGTLSNLNPASYTSQQTFNISYAELNTLLQSKGITNINVASGAPLAIGARWGTGHTWGINGRTGGSFTAP